MNRLNICLVGPGILPIKNQIPPIQITTDGWGAIEYLVDCLAKSMIKKGHIVDIVNFPNPIDSVNYINSQDYDFIHLHYDNHINIFNHLCQKSFCTTTHYGYILKNNMWDLGYYDIFNHLLQSPGLICLSPQIESLFAANNPKGKYLTHLRNGTEVQEYKWRPDGNGRFICLGKVEPRKQQALLAQLAPNISIDFVGPVVDPNFKILSPNHNYLGNWTREEVKTKLTDYSGLILPSFGEAAALVVPEALAAGLSLVITKCSSANLISRPYIYVIPDEIHTIENLEDLLEKCLKNNYSYRTEAREYAVRYFDWAKIAEEYEKKIEEFLIYYPNEKSN